MTIFRGYSARYAAAFLLAFLALPATADNELRETALHMAELLRSARTVVSSHQSLINNPDIADKNLTGERVLEAAIARFRERSGYDPRNTDPASLRGRLMRAQMDAIVKVMSRHQETINAAGVGFKGFIPAVFARLVNEEVGKQMGEHATIKVTAPRELVRNRKARPDAWESEIIEHRLRKEDWPLGEPYTETSRKDGKTTLRLLVPSYYTPSCLRCHGAPKGEVDITGYPKEGGKEGDLGAVISVTLRQ